MRKSLAVLVVSLFVLGLVGLARAEDPQTLKGTMACAKCVLKLDGATECQNVLQVKDGEKTINYFLVDNEVSKKDHGKVCHHAVEGVSVTGTVTEQDGKKWLTATKIEWPAAKE